MPKRDTMHLRNSRLVVLLLVVSINFLPNSLTQGTAAQAQDQQPGPAAPAGPVTQSQPASPQPSTNDSGVFVFKTEVEEVILHATVVDERMRLITTLDHNAFSVSENGSPQSITSFRREDVP